MEQKAIPLAKLNCTHCTLLKDNKCSKTGTAVREPNKHYCFYIFKNFKEETK